MPKTLTCPQIIRNMVERTIRDYIAKKNPAWADIAKITLEKSESSLPSINYSAEVKVKYNDYTFHGWMDEYGTAYVSSVSYKRTKALTDNEWWKPENQKTINGFIYGKQLDEFTFTE